jgi:hypothetical protein
MTTQSVTLQYNDQISVNFTNDAWFNATSIAKHYNKRPNDWLSLESTKEYIKALHTALFPEIALPEKMVTKQNQLVKTKTGGLADQQGSWFHTKLAVAFARWLDVKFSIWCDMQIDKLLHPKRNGLVDLPPAYLTPAMKKHINRQVAFLSKMQVGTNYGALSKSIQDEFNVNKREFIPASKYREVCAFLNCEPDAKALQGELLEPAKVEYQVPAGMMLVDVAELETLRKVPAPVVQKVEPIPAGCVVLTLKEYDAFKKLDAIVSGIRFSLNY